MIAGVLGGMFGVFAIYLSAGLVHWYFSFVFIPLLFLCIALLVEADTYKMDREVQKAEIAMLKSVLFTKQNEARK